MSTLALHTGIVFERELKPLLRSPFAVLFTMVQPLVFLALFGPLTDTPLSWFVPGIVVMSALFGASTTGSNLQLEMQSGSHERTLVAPLRRPALLLGRALKEVVPTIAQALLITAVTIPFGFRPSVPGLLVGLVVVATFAVGLGALSHALALASQGNEMLFWMVQQTLLFPLLILSGMLLPLEGGPGWMQAAAKANPLTHVVDAERALFAGDFGSGSVLAGVVAAAAVCAVGLWVGIRAVRRAAA